MLLAIIDAVAIILAMFIAQLYRFGGFAGNELEGVIEADYTVLSISIAIVWLILLDMWGTRDIKIIGMGTEEYKRIAVSSLYLFGAIAIVSYAFGIQTARGYVGLALPAGLFLLISGRWLYRRHLSRQRHAGMFQRRLMIVGGPSTVLHLYTNLTSAPEAGYEPVTAYLPGYALNAPNGDELPIPVAGVSRDVEGILAAVEQYKVDALAISSGSMLSPRVMRSLGWELQDRGVSMIMAPALTDVAGPRIHTQPVNGLPLIHVSTPKLEGIKGFAKRGFDVLGAALGLIFLSPIFLITALSVRLDSKGPIFFHQKRVGKNGEIFYMHKFRSMNPDAEAKKAELMDQNESDGALFKMKKDPRITKVGAFIRRFSIDELPQLWNVLVGEMSIVGPRPPVPEEVQAYEKHVHRRFMVQPGITGLWQVSGRSGLSWEESVRLDLYYVENWSLIQDMVILFKTVRAVLTSDGAY
ncbi:sugar transferase [Neomicrococcus aestuarii]|uniref:Polyprenyl glycosylphosphotransferase n=1 Tax=Neomicrococcus aestuarii TaxID=556325 RepID=A0A1L2ZRV2_9MICC|nr:sugar transferase [Neomicrococcus aestuarii]APF41731.1 polyprenyl glycosylphosphotransferase [Neomicrococcus aestuarii]